MLNSLIAELQICAAPPFGAAAEARVRVSRPRRSRAGTWRCRCEIRGLPPLPAKGPRQAAERVRRSATSIVVDRSAKHSRPTLRGDVVGEDALQSLTLATRFVQQVLEAFVTGGGRLSYPDGTRVNLGVYFPTALEQVVARVI